MSRLIARDVSRKTPLPRNRQRPPAVQQQWSDAVRCCVITPNGEPGCFDAVVNGELLVARGTKDQKQNEAMAVIVTQRRSLWEVARQVKCQMDAGEDADTLAKELLAWLLEVADQPMPNPNRCLVEIPDTFAVARWPRDAEVAEIARCILGTLKYEPHTADTAMLRRALEGVIERGRKEGAA